MANDANIIKIKRSGTAGAPSSLKLGELAYSYLASTGNPDNNGGDRLFIGANGVNGGTGNANDVIVIGGKYFTDLLDHQRGILTASSALIVDSDKKLDELLVDNLSLNGNTLSTTNSDLNVILSANGAGKVQINTSSNSFTLPAVRTATTGYVLTADTDGTTSWAASASDFSLKAGTAGIDSGNDATINLLTDDLEIRGDAKAISTALSKTTIGSNDHFVLEVKARYASTTAVGVASFDSDSFEFGIIGDVSIKSGGISNTQLANSTTYLGSTQLTLGDASGDNDTLAGLLSVTFDGSTSGTSVLQAQAVASTTTFTLPTTTGTLVGSGDSGTVTNTMLAESTISGISLGDDLADLTVGANLNLTSSDTTYNGGTAQTINLDSALTGITSISASGGTGSVVLNNGTENLTFDASGNLVLPSFTLPNSSGTAGQVLVWPATGFSGVLEWTDISTTLNIAADGPVAPGSHTSAVNLLSDTFTISGNGAISTAVDGTTITVSVATADTTTLGVASFDTSYFTVTTGNVSITSGSITNDRLYYNTISGISLGDDLYALTNGDNIQSFSYDGSTGSVTVALATTLTGLTEVDVGNLKLSGSTIENSSTTGDVVVVANNGSGDKSWTFGGDGNLSVAGKITNLSTPTDANDAATKAYVDATRSGLDVKDSVRAATTGNITLANTQTVDGVALAVGNRVLVKNQDTASENGIYVVASGAWTRATDADNTPAGEVTSGMFSFVEQGTTNADSGWVLTTDGDITLDSTSLTFVQFSGAGQITAGAGLSKTGNTLDVNVANGIEISGDNVQLASSVAGDGLTYTNGTLDVVGTSNRISVTANAVDISTSYVGQNTITTLGTITTGTWTASVIDATHGGTNQTTWAKGDLLYASAANTLTKLNAGNNGEVLQLQDGLPVWGVLDGGTYGP